MTTRCSRGHLAALAIATVLLSGGCASTATLTRWRPAEYDLGPVRRLVVLPVEGPEQLARQAESILVSDLRASGRFEVLRLQDLPPLPGSSPRLPDGRLNRTAAIDSAAQARADAVLLATLARHEDGGMEMGKVTIRFGEPTTSVAIRFQLLDTCTGQCLVDDRVVESFTGELGADVAGRYAEQRVMQEMVTDNAHAVAAKLAPYAQPATVELAGDSWFASARVRAGCKLAKAGRWNDAAKIWQAVVDSEPDNHAARYNLGLAREAEQDLEAAAEMFQAAIAVDDRDAYRRAAERVAASLEDQRVILARRTPAPPAARTAPPEPPATQPPRTLLANRPAAGPWEEEPAAAPQDPLRRLPAVPAWPVPAGFSSPRTATTSQPAPYGPY